MLVLAEVILKSLPCLFCGRTNASYVSQCIHCQHVFKIRYAENREENKHIILILTEFRQGKSFDEIEESLNTSGITRIGINLPWDKQAIAYVIHQFTQEGIDDNKELTITRCQKCRAPIVDSVCPKGHSTSPTPPLKKDTSIARVALIFNIVIIGGLFLFIFLCKKYVHDGEGFDSRFGALILIIVGSILAGITWLIGNIILIAAAATNARNRHKHAKPSSS